MYRYRDGRIALTFLSGNLHRHLLAQVGRAETMRIPKPQESVVEDVMCGRPPRVKVFFDTLEQGVVAVMCPAFAATGLAAGLDGIRDASAVIKQARSKALDIRLAASHPVFDPLSHRVVLHLVPVGGGPPISPELRPGRPRDNFRL